MSAAGTNSGNVSVLLGKGDGSFQAAVNYSAYRYPVFVTAADVNGDSKLDLLVASMGGDGNDEVVVLPGTGNGTFQAGIDLSVTADPSWVSVADFNGDGKQDLLVTHCCDNGKIASMQGLGDGTFEAEMEFGTGAFSSSAVADFNADSKPDVAFTNYVPGAGRTLSAYLNISVTQGPLAITNAAGNPLKAPPISADSIATAKGSGLATGAVINSAVSPPTTLGGTTASVQDAQGVSRAAELFYVSPGQVNFLIPAGTAVGTATVKITAGDGHVSVGTVAITPIAPAVFTLNSDSLAAAYVQRVHGDGSQSIEFLYAVDGANNVTFPPIDMGPASDQVYVNIFGTGFRGRSALSAVVVKVGGVNVPALYAGASTYDGEDQLAILLPRSLVGAGRVLVELSANGNASNTTTLKIR